MREWRVAIALTAVLVAAAVVSGCTLWQLQPPAAAVQSVLELRSANSTDAASYARYFEDPSLATALAEDAAAQAGDSSPIPEWRRPAVMNATETSAVVVVTWKRTADFADWPETTSFVLRKIGGRWLVVDAEAEAEETSKTP